MGHYVDVNRRFADATDKALVDDPDAVLWVHDYHLMLVPRLVHERRPEQVIGFFLHVPWPSPEAATGSRVALSAVPDGSGWSTADGRGRPFRRPR